MLSLDLSKLLGHQPPYLHYLASSCPGIFSEELCSLKTQMQNSSWLSPHVFIRRNWGLSLPPFLSGPSVVLGMCVTFLILLHFQFFFPTTIFQNLSATHFLITYWMTNIYWVPTLTSNYLDAEDIVLNEERKTTGVFIVVGQVVNTQRNIHCDVR